MQEQSNVAVAYTRVSTIKQALEGVSLGEQERAARGRAEADGFEFAGAYVDAGISGKRDDRPELQRLLADAERGAFSRVYIFKLDRLSRRAADLLRIDARLERAGVALVSLSESIDTSTSNGRLIRTVLSAVAEMESENTSERVRFASHARAREGRRNGGPRPFGYLQADGVLSTVAHEAEVVRRVYREYLAGRSQAEIARRLNADGIGTVRGARWCQQRIRDLLGNRLYAGFVRNGPDEYPGKHEAIIEMDVWAEVAALRAAKRRTPTGWRARPTAGTHLFVNGMLRCGSCGSPMLPRSPRNQQGAIHEFYVCGGRKYGMSECSVTEFIRREEIDGAVLRYFLKVGLDYEATRDHFDQLAQRRIASTVAMLTHAEAEERRAAARITRVTSDYRDGALTVSEWRSHMDELHPQREAAAAEVARLRARQGEIEAEVAETQSDGEDEALRYLAGVRAAIAGTVRDSEGVAAVRTALLRLFDRFILHKSGSDNYPQRVYGDLAFLGDEETFTIEPIIRESVVRGYMEHGTPILCRLGLLSETVESGEIQTASRR